MIELNTSIEGKVVRLPMNTNNMEEAVNLVAAILRASGANFITNPGNEVSVFQVGIRHLFLKAMDDE